MQIFTRRPFRNLLLSIPVWILLAGCNPSLKITGMDISSLYTGLKSNSLHINQLYNINDSLSIISIELPAGLIPPDPATKKYTRQGKLKYEIIGAGKRVELFDSASFAIPDTLAFQSFISHTWTFRAPVGNDYFVKATYSVPGMMDDFLLLEFFGKKNHLTQSWYRIQTESGDFLSGNRLSYSQAVRLVSESAVNSTMNVKCYFRNFPPPPPPFVEERRSPFDYTPDSTFTLELKNGRSVYFTPAKAGFYFFQADTNLMEGPTVFRMNNGFPKVTQHTLMLEALRYLTSSKEYQQLLEHRIPKLAVDSFWIVSAGRPDLATELIRKYYQRVEVANQLYTSFTEGWKTDRGMIFIIMGKPTRVFRSFEQEVWIYGEYEDPRALKFYFNKAINPFSKNDYVLVRNPYYKSIWYQNVQVWRR